ncbi:MAG: Tautomerase PptA [Syntrophorhabdus sp. PtaU1.Bin050]|nr:MAG: Tautomerase PptA [Syntrophorhabdus sp. PtaU1.Bin050]
MKKSLDNLISRRKFLKESAIMLGAVAVSDFTAIAGAGQVNSLNTLSKEREMPHVIVKLWPGRSEQEKKQLADAIVNDVVTYTKCDESSVSVAIEEIKSSEWAEKVYKPDILDKQKTLYKKPGYSM